MLEAPLLYDQLLKVLVIMVRMGSLFLVFPIFGQGSLMAPIKVAGAITLSICLYPAVVGKLPQWSMASLPQNSEILSVIFREFVIGLGMGLVARCFFSSCVSAAEWVGSQMGFSMGSIFSNESQEQISSWSEFNQWLAIMLFFSVGGHILMIQALVDSYKFDFPHLMERLLDPRAGAMFWIEIGTSFFSWMLKLSAPMLAVLLLLQISLGILSKFVPQINVWMVSIPVTIGIGVFLFSVMSPMYGDALKNLFAEQIQGQYLWLKFVGTR